MIINIYWLDLSEEGQDRLINAGFVLTEQQRRCNEPIGVFKSDTREEIENQLFKPVVDVLNEQWAAELD